MTPHPPKVPALKKQARKSSPQPPAAGNTAKVRRLLPFAFIAVFAAIPFALGKYIEFNSPGAYDSGSNVYSARHILEGARIGVDEIPSAQPGTLVVNMLGVRLFGFSETGPKLIQMLLQAAALVLMFIAARRLFGLLAAGVGVVIASVYLSAPLIAKFGNVKEQYMIACMVLGISALVLANETSYRRMWTFLAGAFVAAAPTFKATGTSAVVAIGVFVLAQPVFKHKSVKQTAAEVLLLLAGAATCLTPMYVWLAIHGAPASYWPYAFVPEVFGSLVAGGPESSAVSSYVAQSRQGSSFAEQWPRVLRYYTLLILPIALAITSIAARVIRMLRTRRAQSAKTQPKSYDRFVLLFAVWWLLDMAYVWISPRSYEQYYLPLNASAAMLAGYIIALYSDSLSKSTHKGRWVITGVLGLVVMIVASWHIFFGIEKSPHSGTAYGQKRRGYAQKLEQIAQRRANKLRAPWELVAEYIRIHSSPEDKIYVWGWYPGIYVQAQRLSPAAKAFEANMHIIPPEPLSERVAEIVTAFEKQPPKFIVDTHKIHFPWDRPPLELWPRMKDGFLPADNENLIIQYNQAYTDMLARKIGEAEAKRYEAMKPLRRYVMNNYKIVPVPFGRHVLFERK